MIKKDTLVINKYSYDSLGNMISDESKYTYVKFGYNKNNQLVSIDRYIDEGNLSSNYEVAKAYAKRQKWVNPQNTKSNYTWTFDYDNDGRMIRSNINGYGYIDYEYDKYNRIDKEVYYDINKIKTAVYIDKYDNHNNLIHRTEYRVIDLQHDSIVNEIIFEFDKKRNPFKGFNRLNTPGEGTNSNNIVTKKTNDYVLKYSYIYNNLGFPIKKDDLEYVYE